MSCSCGHVMRRKWAGLAPHPARRQNYHAGTCMTQTEGTERIECHLVPEVLTTSKPQVSLPEDPQPTDSQGDSHHTSYRELLGRCSGLRSVNASCSASLWSCQGSGKRFRSSFPANRTRRNIVLGRKCTSRPRNHSESRAACPRRLSSAATLRMLFVATAATALLWCRSDEAHILRKMFPKMAMKPASPVLTSADYHL